MTGGAYDPSVNKKAMRTEIVALTRENKILRDANGVLTDHLGQIRPLALQTTSVEILAALMRLEAEMTLTVAASTRVAEIVVEAAKKPAARKKAAAAAAVKKRAVAKKRGSR